MTQHAVSQHRRPRGWHLAVCAAGLSVAATAVVGATVHGSGHYVDGTASGYVTSTSMSPTTITSQPAPQWSSTGFGGMAQYQACLNRYSDSPSGSAYVRSFCADEYPTATLSTPAPVTSTSMVPTETRTWNAGTSGHMVSDGGIPPVVPVGAVTGLLGITAAVLMYRRARSVSRYRRDAAAARRFDRTYPAGSEHMCATSDLQQFAAAARRAAHSVFADRLHWQTHTIAQCEQQARWYSNVASRAQTAYESRLGGVDADEVNALDDDSVTVTPTPGGGVGDVPVDIDAEDGDF